MAIDKKRQMNIFCATKEHITTLFLNDTIGRLFLANAPLTYNNGTRSWLSVIKLNLANTLSGSNAIRICTILKNHVQRYNKLEDSRT